MWKNDLIPHAGKLKFIQSISSGMDQYSKEQLGAKNVRLASAAGVNARAVAEHAIALILAVARRLPEARDNQHKKMWRGMIGDLTQREDELGGKTLLIVGMGRIGSHLAKLAKAFDMKVIGIRRDPAQGANGADSIHGMGDLVKLVPQADFVALACALTPETTGLMSAAAFAAMKPSAVFVNVARGKVADEAALIKTMQGNRIWAAAIDVTVDEPLPEASPLWSMPNVFITPHTGGRDARLRGQRARHPDGESRAPVARRQDPAQPGALSRLLLLLLLLLWLLLLLLGRWRRTRRLGLLRLRRRMRLLLRRRRGCGACGGGWGACVCCGCGAG